MMHRLRAMMAIFAGFVIGLFLARIDHIVPLVHSQRSGVVRMIASIVDWTAPPIAGAMVAGAFLIAQRYKRLHVAEVAASRVLAERLVGVERRQAIWVVAAAIAHDLKNPLHNLQLLVEEVREASEPQRRTDLLQRIHENVDRATARISDLARAGQAPEEVRKPLDLGSALVDLRRRIASSGRHQGTEVVVECPNGLAVRADSLALCTAVENVVANALAALSTSGGRVVLRARRAADVVELEIEDNGPGVPEQLRSRLFTPFASGGEGIGLGLPIARALARAGGGDLVCSSSDPGHAAFRFTFPSE